MITLHDVAKSHSGKELSKQCCQNDKQSRSTSFFDVHPSNDHEENFVPISSALCPFFNSYSLLDDARRLFLII